MLLMTALSACRSTDGGEEPVLGLRASAAMAGHEGNGAIRWGV